MRRKCYRTSPQGVCVQIVCVCLCKISILFTKAAANYAKRPPLGQTQAELKHAIQC